MSREVMGSAQEFFILSMDLHEDGGITQDELLSMPAVTALSIKRGAMQLIDAQKPFQLLFASWHVGVVVRSYTFRDEWTLHRLKLLL